MQSNSLFTGRELYPGVHTIIYYMTERPYKSTISSSNYQIKGNNREHNKDSKTEQLH